MSQPTERPEFEAIARNLAEDLLRIGAVSLAPDDPYTWASGLNSPIYCDNRLTLAFPEVRRGIAAGFAERVRARQVLPEAVVGIATAGIPHAAWLADLLDLPMAYVRAKPKAHGRGNQIEGRLRPGQRVIVIEDLISTGGSSLGAVRALQDAYIEVDAVGAIFAYGLDVAAAQFREAGVEWFSLTRFDVLLDVAVASDRLPASALATIRAWRRDPMGWRP